MWVVTIGRQKHIKENLLARVTLTSDLQPTLDPPLLQPKIPNSTSKKKKAHHN